MDKTELRRVYDTLTPEQKTAADTRLAAIASADSNLNGVVATLRQWASDGRGTTVTSGNAVATLQTVVNRLSTFFDRFADLLESQDRS